MFIVEKLENQGTLSSSYMYYNQSTYSEVMHPQSSQDNKINHVFLKMCLTKPDWHFIVL